jgi:UDP-glucose 4-epimerase
MNVLVTGGAGYIGSHAVRGLLDQGHRVTVIDNLSQGHKEALDSRANFILGSTGDRQLVLKLLNENKIEAVMHFAANIEVGESVIDPGKYYQNNFSHTLALLGAMADAKVKKIVFSSTAAVYGNPASNPIKETETLAPINPYGKSKMMSEMAIVDFLAAHGIAFAILRYFNVAGASEDAKIGEDHHPESHLIPRILAAARNSGETVKIYGVDYPTPDGTCIRDYVHVLDLVDAHILALQNIKAGEGEIYNLGSESGFSVREVISACEKVCGKKLAVVEEGRRPGDSAVLVASSQKIKNALGWAPKYTQLETIAGHAWNWHLKRPKGYEA